MSQKNHMPEKHPPLHMDKGSRMERLYEYLVSLGLYVSPVLIDNSGDEIDYLCVSGSLPGQKIAQEATSAGVGFPVFRTEIRDVPGTSERRGNNVAEFPTVVG